MKGYVKMKNKCPLISFALALILILSVCTTVVAAAVPSPNSDFYVYDGADVISSETEKHIVDKCKKLESKTGGQIVFVTMESIDDVDINTFADTIFVQWGIGDKEKHNGLLFLIVLDDLDYWATYGTGIQSRFNPKTIKTMAENYFDPYFLSGQHDKAVRTLFDKFLSSYEKLYSIDVEATDVADNVEAKADGSTSAKVVTTVFVVLAIVLFVAVVIFLLRKYNDAQNAPSQKRPQPGQGRTLPPRRRNGFLGQTYLPNGQPQKKSAPRKGTRPPANQGGARPRPQPKSGANNNRRQG